MYAAARAETRLELLRAEYDGESEDEIRAHMVSFLKASGIAVRLQNAAARVEAEAARDAAAAGAPAPAAEVDAARGPVRLPNPAAVAGARQEGVLGAARVQWDKRLRYEVRLTSNKLRRPAVRRRADAGADGGGAAEPAALAAGAAAGVGPSRFVYTCDDLLDAVSAAVNPNLAGTVTRAVGWGLVRVQLRVPTLDALRRRLGGLRLEAAQHGVDDLHHAAGAASFSAAKMAAGRALLARGASARDAREFARTGVPPALRPRVWCAAVGCAHGRREERRYEGLVRDVREWDVATDDLVRLDVAATADKPDFFVFAAELLEVMLAFSRDSTVARDAAVPVNTAPHTVPVPPPLGAAAAAGGPAPFGGAAAADLGGEVAVPPSRVVPFYRQSLLAAPLCFLFERSHEVFALYRALYARYFCRLHVISAAPGSAAALARLFEELVVARRPRAFYHAVGVGLHPTKVAFPWIFTAFSGWLPVSEVLQLWDRVVAYDTLDVVAVLAAAVFCFRSAAVRKASTADEIAAAFREVSSLRVVPLLQHFLFGGDA